MSGAIASVVAKEIAQSLAGSGGGDARFGQGGAEGNPDLLPSFEKMVLDNILRKITRV